MKEILKNIYKISGSKMPRLYIPIPLAGVMGRFFDFVQRMGLPALLPTQRVKFLTEDKKFDSKKAKKILGWKPKIGLEKGLKKTFKYYKDHKLL